MRRHQIVLLVLLAIVASGCARARYRHRADRDAYGIIGEKTACAPWESGHFTIASQPGSRLTTPGPLDDPCLPDPSPQLYAFELPATPQRDASRFRSSADLALSQRPNVWTANGGKAFIPEGPASSLSERRPGLFRLPETLRIDRDLHLAAFQPPDAGAVPNADLAFPAQNAPPVPDANAPTTGANAGGTSLAGQSVLRIVPIRESAWQSIPQNCLVRAIEFDSVREEYRKTFGTDPDESLQDNAERLALEDLVQLGVTHSREYQTEKERLYRAALALTLQRYDYQLKFSPSGNGTDVDWRHSRTAGITENSLSIPSAAALERVMATGGNFLARFANDVVLTFNGPDGFAADVGSELFFEFTQSLFQRDVVFERLTQAERDVVYAARDYARFRKQFFRNIAGDYYNLLLTYRGIEIGAQDFFSNQRGFDQALEEFRNGDRSRIQVDQFEQNALSSRSRLIRSCNSLEQDFDQLKLRIGIPPETPINLDLTELRELTARDEEVVAIERIQRRRRNLLNIRNETGTGGAAPMISAATNLARRLVELRTLQDRNLEQPTEEPSFEENLLLRLQVQDAAVSARETQRQLEIARTEESAGPIRIFQLQLDVIQELVDVGTLRLRLGEPAAEARARHAALAAGFDQLRTEFDSLFERLRGQTDEDSNQLLLSEINSLVDKAGELFRTAESIVNLEDLEEPAPLIQQALERSGLVASETTAGLAPLEIPMDDAMITALVTRFDLMNQRGELADAWRQIKIAGDDLRSILNLSASQSVRTRDDVNRVADFTWDESETRLGVTFDAPLNRRAQRNRYRTALIDYNAALRNLMQAEDEIKVEIRNDLRALRLDREQYAIAVASAALARDRVFSTRFQIQLGNGNVTARDFLEAQQAYTSSLSDVASEHIGYLLDRIDLFLDLELLTVDGEGFWPELYDEAFAPSARYMPPAGTGPAYGRLPAGVHYSDCMRRMDCIPMGPPRVFEAGQGSDLDAANFENTNLDAPSSAGTDEHRDLDGEPSEMLDEIDQAIRQ